MQNAEIAERRKTAIARGVGMQTQVYVERAENAHVWDVEGNRYIDFAAGIAVVNTGHRHPKVIAAVQKQLDSFTHTCHQVLPYENYIRLGERLNALVPGDFDKRTLFVTTGAEAVENAIKIARHATGRSAVIAFGGAFHGRTFMGMALTGKVQPYKAGFGAMMPDVFHVPFPIDLHGVSVDDAMAGITKLFKADLDPARVAAIILEPVQGEGGFYQAPAELMRALRKLCDDHGIVLIADEVQTGFARTGKLFAMEHYDVVPDLTCMAKALAGGFPLAAVTGKAEIMDASNPGGLGGTYGGNPVACAAALASIGSMKEYNLNGRAKHIEELATGRLRELAAALPGGAGGSVIGDIRGRGAMLAIELVQAGSKEPNPELTKAVAAACLKEGVIILTCGTYGNVIRLLPPLVIGDELLKDGLEVLAAAIKANA